MRSEKAIAAEAACLRELQAWLVGCTRGGKISRNTLAIGIVVINHLNHNCPVDSVEVLSQGGEIRGARSGLGKILKAYGIPATFLKEVTTRQAHQDGQRLLDRLDWGSKLAGLSDLERGEVLAELARELVVQAYAWLRRQCLKPQLDHSHAPSTWIHAIVEMARDRSCGIVEQHLVGAKLERRYKDLEISNYPSHAGDAQTERHGDFVVSKLIYHVTASPTRNVIHKCAENARASLHPVLLVPQEQEAKARIFAQDEGLAELLTIASIEDFMSLNIIELSAEENKDLFVILMEIVEIYNKRLAKVETDLSLQIKLR